MTWYFCLSSSQTRLSDETLSYADTAAIKLESVESQASLSQQISPPYVQSEILFYTWTLHEKERIENKQQQQQKNTVPVFKYIAAVCCVFYCVLLQAERLSASGNETIDTHILWLHSWTLWERVLRVNLIQPLSAPAICSSFEHAHKGLFGVLRLEPLILFVFCDGRSFWREMNCDVSDFICFGTLTSWARREIKKQDKNLDRSLAQNWIQIRVKYMLELAR